MEDNANGQFNTNRELEFASYYETKTGKLVTALYMITNFFPDTEPMKWKLRDRGLLLLSGATELKDRPSAKRSEILERSLQVLNEVMALLEIAHLSDFITQMNYTVLSAEYGAMVKLLSERPEVKTSLSNFSLESNFFETPELKRELPESGKGKQMTVWGIDRGRSQSESVSTPSTYARDAATPQDAAAFEKDETSMAPLSKKTKGKVAKKRNKRRDLILDVLQELPEVTIKDIAMRLTDISEKTIQRQLVAMVKDGTLKRTGERRWSRYSLANM